MSRPSLVSQLHLDLSKLVQRFDVLKDGVTSYLKIAVRLFQPSGSLFLDSGLECIIDGCKHWQLIQP